MVGFVLIIFFRHKTAVPTNFTLRSVSEIKHNRGVATEEKI